MPRIAAIDFGLKRTGIAISDPLAMIANGLETVPTAQLMGFLEKLRADKSFNVMVVGEPKKLDGSDGDIEQNIKFFIEAFGKKFPEVEVKRMDERYTSSIALQTMISAGSKKSDRQKKGNIDKISATLILQEYLNHHSA